MTLDDEDIAAVAESLGVGGLPLIVHSSFRAFGGTVRSPDAVIQGLLNVGCTVMTPTFAYELEVAPPDPQVPARNGISPDQVWREHSRRYQPDDNQLSQAAMGAIPTALLRRSDRLRSAHPLNSFAAAGPLANELLAEQSATDVYAPLQRLCELGGQIILMGVDFTTLTLLHYAESQSGRALFRRWVNGPDAAPLECRVGGCSNGFRAFHWALADIEQRSVVGAAIWRILPAMETLERATRAVSEAPELTHCGDDACVRCADAVAGGPVVSEP